MGITFSLITMSILLGFSLAMDAFSVSLSDGLGNPKMKPAKLCMISGIFALFQALMPMIGWFFVHTAAEHFETFNIYIPYIALFLLLYIGGQMLCDSIRENGSEDNVGSKVTPAILLVQGIATSIDALSVGFTIADYSLVQALVSVAIIAAVTFAVCSAGLVIGKKFGTKLAGKAGVLGGVILIAIGIEIFIKGVFF